MKKNEAIQIVAYGMVAIISVAGAFLISLRFIGQPRAQEPVEQEASPASDATPAPDASTAPANDANVNPAANPATDSPNDPNAAAAGAPVQPTGGAAYSELEGFLEPFLYDVVNRRDPFIAYAEYVPPDANTPSRPLSPAQRYDLDQLQLVGVMWDIKDPKAMFLDPEKEVLILGRDEGIGNRNGYIASIREGEVVVVEAIRKRGDTIYKTRVLRIER